ncbi:hypothetical protein V5799_022674 [Amblyomma americanum]|uniref:BTB domain-containing protein n=1 Tax=Amblyomma americanum TaxID=6943 RepID=A0AAQ4FLV2_AMBAM
MERPKFCVKWKKHHSNMLAEFWQLLSNEALVDVTLACEGLSLKAHKVVLSACSPFFQALFVENPCEHPIVILPAMRYIDLKAIVEFMYRGEVNVPLDQIAALLKTAETLKVKGLAECTNENKNGGLVTSVDGAADAGPVGTPRAESAPLSKRKGSRGPSSRASNVAVSSSTAVPSGARHGSSVQASISQHTQDSIGDDVEEGDDADFDLEILDVMEEFTTTENVPEFPDVASSSQVLGYESQQSHHTGFTSDNSALVPAQRSLPSDFSITSQVDIEPSPYSLIPYDDQAIPPVVAAFPAAALSGDGASIAMAVTDASGVPAVAGPSGYQQSTPSHAASTQTPDSSLRRVALELPSFSRRTMDRKLQSLLLKKEATTSYYTAEKATAAQTLVGATGLSASQAGRPLFYGECHRRLRVREPLEPGEQLAITLSYLARGQDIKDIALAYRVGIETARVAIHFCCQIIWARLKDQFMKVPSEGDWVEIAEGFKK